MLSNFCLLSRCFWIGRYSTIFLELCDPMFKYYNTLKRVPFNVVFTFENRYKSRGLIWGGVRSLRRVYQIRINSRSWRGIRAIRFFIKKTWFPFPRVLLNENIDIHFFTVWGTCTIIITFSKSKWCLRRFSMRQGNLDVRNRLSVSGL